MPVRSRAVRVIPLALLGLLACGHESERGARTERTQERERAELVARGIRASAAEGVAMGISSSDARFVRNLVGFQGPESVKYDAEQDVYFITNQTGAGSVKDDNGYISRVSAGDPDSATVFAQGGRNGVVLHSPKGTALHGDTLWVADIDVLRAFDRRSGAPLGTIDFAPLGAVQLNDVAIGPDGAIRVTDTGIIMSPKGVVYKGPSRVFIVGPGRRIGVAGASAAIPWANGIAWDSTSARWIVASFDPFVGRLFSMSADGSEARVIRQGAGRLDGVEVLPGGQILFASWADSSIHLLDARGDRQVIREVPEPADIGIDTRRHRLAIPLAVLGRVQLWDIAALDGRARRPLPR